MREAAAPGARPLAGRLVTVGRPVLFGVAGLTVLVGLGVGWAIAPHAWAVDLERNIRAAEALLSGTFGSDRGYLYSPLAALLTVPLTWLPLTAAALALIAVKLGVMAWGVRHDGRGLSMPDLLLVGAAAVASVPTLHDLLLGNVTVFIVGALALVAWRSDGWWSGIALGLVLATAPKPQVLPVLVWMLVFRRQALVGAGVTAGLATLATVLVVGVEPYRAWVDVLRAPEYLVSPMYGNLTPDALLPALALPIKVAALAGFAIALVRGETPAFVAALALGLLVAPYTMAYAAMALLLAVRPLALAAPRAAMGFAATGSLAVVVLLPAYALAWLAAAVAVRFRPTTVE